MKKIYCAGPLFNPREREDMKEIASVLENSGYKVFLPQRDGIELSKAYDLLIERGISPENAKQVLSSLIFFIDVYQVADSDGLIINLNGRVPDEGAMVEAGIAWTLGKPVVIFKSDTRTAFNGTDNPLVLGLAKFSIISDLNELAAEFNRQFSNGHGTKKIDYKMAENWKFKIGKLLYKDMDNFRKGEIDHNWLKGLIEKINSI